jgi:hypothetical protein
MQDLPTAAELVEAVRDFLERDVFPILEGRPKFHTRVAMNVLAIVERELTLGASVDARERAGLCRLLAREDDAEASILELNESLASGIRDGTFSAPRDELVEHLRATVGDKLAIANPKYID